MSTLTFQSVLNEVAYAMGLDPDVNLQENAAGALCRYIEKRVREGWRSYDWPDLVRTEQRQYRLDWDGTATYAAGAEVYDPAGQVYYQSLQDGNVNHPVSETSWWVAAVNLDRYVALNQAGQMVMGEPLRAWARNPMTERNPLEVRYFRSANGIQFYTDAPARPWIRFRLPTPKFTIARYDALRVYAAGTAVYLLADGNCYVCAAATVAGEDPVGTPDKWTVQGVPEFLRDYVVAAVLADTLREEGQSDKATAQETVADDLLTFEQDQLTVQQGQTRRYAVRTR